MSDVTLREELCNGCGACLAVCKVEVYAKAEGSVRVAAAERCWSCGHCVAVCPQGAIVHSDYPLSSCPPIEETLLPEPERLLAALRARRSTRLFAERVVARETLRELLAVGRYAPSAGNGQPVDWLVVDTPARVDELSAKTVAALAQTGRLLRRPVVRAWRRLSKGAEQAKEDREAADSLLALTVKRQAGLDPIFFRAPAVLVAHVPESGYFRRDDAVLAMYNVELMAARLGLGTCQIGYFKIALDRSAALRALLGLPPGRVPEATLVVGYPKFRWRRLLPRREPVVSWMGERSP
jgi:nitroreductase/NAD-dependent dihydropyrimidine dehydrogenase PreA subunit